MLLKATKAQRPTVCPYTLRVARRNDASLRPPYCNGHSAVRRQNWAFSADPEAASQFSTASSSEVHCLDLRPIIGKCRNAPGRATFVASHAEKKVFRLTLIHSVSSRIFFLN